MGREVSIKCFPLPRPPSLTPQFVSSPRTRRARKVLSLPPLSKLPSPFLSPSRLQPNLHQRHPHQRHPHPRLLHPRLPLSTLMSHGPPFPTWLPSTRIFSSHSAVETSKSSNQLQAIKPPLRRILLRVVTLRFFSLLLLRTVISTMFTRT